MLLDKRASLVALSVKNLPAIRDPDLIPGSGRSPREGTGDPLQYSCLENPMHRGSWQAAVKVVTKSWTKSSEHLINFFKESEL